jgi:hypothetical protein
VRAARPAKPAKTFEQKIAVEAKIQKVLAPPTKAELKASRLAILSALPTDVLEVRKEYASRQVRYLSRVLTVLQRELKADEAFKKAISTLKARQGFWDTQTGAIGPILAARRIHGS